MPDAGASRKRQIQVALRPFGDIAASGRCAQTNPAPRGAVLQVFLQGRALSGHLAIEAPIAWRGEDSTSPHRRCLTP
jgi:hypothetical protein